MEKKYIKLTVMIGSNKRTYCAPNHFTIIKNNKKNGEGFYTDEEVEQHLYNDLIEDVKREEFEKNTISILKNYKGEDEMKDWKSVYIEIEYKNKDKHHKIGIHKWFT